MLWDNAAPWRNTEPWLHNDLDGPIWFRQVQPPGRMGPLDPISLWEQWYGTHTVTTSTPYVIGAPTVLSGSSITTTSQTWDSGTVAGDMLLAWIGQGGGIQTISSNSLSMTQVQRQQNPNNTAALTLFMKVLTSGDISTGSVNFTFAASQRWSITLVTVRNHNGVIDQIGSTTSGTAVTPVTVNSATPTLDNELAVGGIGGQVNATSTDVAWDWPGPLAEIADTVGTGAVARSFITVAQLQMPGVATTSGPDTATPTNSVNYGAFRVTIPPPQPATGARAISATTAAVVDSVGATVKHVAPLATTTPLAADAQNAAKKVVAVATATPVVLTGFSAAKKAAPAKTTSPLVAVSTDAVVKVGLAVTLTPVVLTAVTNRSNAKPVAVFTPVVVVSITAVAHKGSTATTTPVILTSQLTVGKRFGVKGMTPVVLVSTDAAKKAVPVKDLTPLVLTSNNAVKHVSKTVTTTPLVVVSTSLVAKRTGVIALTPLVVDSTATRGIVPRAVVAFTPVLLTSNNAVKHVSKSLVMTPVVLASTTAVRKRGLAVTTTPVIVISTVIERKTSRAVALTPVLLASNPVVRHQATTIAARTYLVVISTDKVERPLEFGSGRQSEGSVFDGTQFDSRVPAGTAGQGTTFAGSAGSSTAQLGVMSSGGVATGRQG